MSAVATPVTRPFPAVEGVEHRFVDVNGLHMHVAEAGQGEPILLLHGWPQHWYEWRKQIPELAQHYRVICPDLRGFGWTDAPPGLYDKETLANDILGLLDELGIDKPVKLIGHDWGGWIGFLIALNHPERLERYLALNIPPPMGKVEPRTIAGIWRFWYQWLIASPGLGRWTLQNRPQFLRWILRGPGKRPSIWTDEEIDAFLDPLLEPARTDATIHLYRTFVTREFPSIVAGKYAKSHLTVPTLLLFGADDFAISPALLRGADEHADDLTIELIPDTGHFIAEERPQLVNERALEFFAR